MYRFLQSHGIDDVNIFKINNISRFSDIGIQDLISNNASLFQRVRQIDQKCLLRYVQWAVWFSCFFQKHCAYFMFTCFYHTSWHPQLDIRLLGYIPNAVITESLRDLRHYKVL